MLGWKTLYLMAGCSKSECKTQARCSVYHKAVEWSSSGHSSITDHTKEWKHKDAVEKRKNFFKAGQDKQATGDNEKVVINDDRQSTITDIYSSSNSSIKTEIIWILKCLIGGSSGRFNDDIGEIFLAMFPDLKSVINNFSLARTKSSYMINHGLAPYFKNELETGLQKSEVYVYSFDESLNSVTQMPGMDLYIRYWDKTGNVFKVRYYGPSFLGHGRHYNILNHFMSLTRSLK